MRTCSDNKFERHQQLGRPCLLFHIEKCSGPCVGEIDKERYDELVGELLEFLDGDTDTVVKRLETAMRDAGRRARVRAGRPVRDRLTSVRKAIEKQQMVADRNEDLDVIGIADDELEAAVQVFFVRRGRVVGRKGFVLDKVEDVSPDELVGRILLEPLRRAAAARRAQAGARAGRARGDRPLRGAGSPSSGAATVAIRVPQRGDKRTLQETVTQNAKEEFTRHRLKRASDHNSRAKALNELQEQLGLPEAPLRIECYDMSHIQGTDYVGSMVVIEDGLAEEVASTAGSRSRASTGNDDFAAMEEVLTRRLTAYLAERRRPVSERAGQVRLPAAAAAGRRRQGPARRGRPGARGAGPRRGDPRRLAGQAVRGGVRARAGRPDPHAPPVRGALPAPADPRRGPPLRHHVPPRAAGQAHDDELGPRRHPRPRARRAGSGW